MINPDQSSMIINVSEFTETAENNWFSILEAKFHLRGIDALATIFSLSLQPWWLNMLQKFLLRC